MQQLNWRVFAPALLRYSVAMLPMLWLGTSLAANASDTNRLLAPSGASAGTEIRVRSFLPEKPLNRARRPAAIKAVVENTGDVAATLRPRLTLPEGVRLARPAGDSPVQIQDAEEAQLVWELEADEPVQGNCILELKMGEKVVASASLPMQFLAPVKIDKPAYIPEPQPVPTSILVGAHHCPLWEADKPRMWDNVRKHPERTPALGFYAQENPEVADWETKWAVEHGISFFIYCWYRTSQGGAVQTQFGTAIHDALFKSKFASKMRFTIMWENQSRGRAGVADERDLFANLLPYWIENYFKHPSYLKIDNRPVLFIYRPEFLVQDLGGVENVAKAFARMREACREAGFAGLYLLGEYRGLDASHLQLMKKLGLDYTFAYCWYVPNNPTPEQAIQAQMQYIKKTQELGVLPQVVTVSQAWSGWADEGTIWKIPPPDFERLLRQAKDFVGTLPAESLGSKLLLLDNWNEWGEGHYIAPYREFGFGYLDAVRKVFALTNDPHTDLIPEDIGRGPYDTAYHQWLQKAEDSRKLASGKVQKAGGSEAGLIGWWAFDEEPRSPVALDYSGHRLGGKVQTATRIKGIDGNALACQGGCVVVESNPRLSPTAGLTIECWVKTDRAGQDNKWLVNRVYGGGTSTGYRLGVLEGKPCFEVPLTDWSHHLKANTALPTGRWVHLAGTFDGAAMKIYVDGEERGTMARPGPVKENAFPLCLGSYEANHPAHFTGLLDEVKLYDRALPEAELRVHARSFKQ